MRVDADDGRQRERLAARRLFPAAMPDGTYLVTVARGNGEPDVGVFYVDCANDRAVEGHDGPTGVTGSRGEMGPQGPPGPAGPAG